jgi:hypothetical protein
MMHDGPRRRRLAGARLDNGVCATDALKPANLAVRVLLELYARAALAYWARGPGAPPHEGHPWRWRAQPLPVYRRAAK